MASVTHQRRAALSDRQRRILQDARNQGRVVVEDLADSYSVTQQTIRRDLGLLCDRRLLQRVHGGAIAHGGVENLDYAQRRHLAEEEKRRIGQHAAQLVPDDCSVFINIGTTTEQVAAHLTEHRGLLVITNNVNVVNTLLPVESIKVIAAGGLVRREDGGIVGDATASFVRQFKFDYAVIGASAIDEDGALLDFDFREVTVAQAIIESARSVILVADTMKFKRNAPFRIGDISDVDYIVTDCVPPSTFVSHCREAGVSIVTSC